jgi:hypothetical protein
MRIEITNFNFPAFGENIDQPALVEIPGNG